MPSIYAQNGIVRTYFDDGCIESEVAYVNDILDGISVFYFPNGNIREEISFSFGKKKGICKKYYQNGLLKEERNFNDGLLDGLAKMYYENGALKEILNYDNGKLIKKNIVPYDSSYAPPIEAFLAGNRQYKLAKELNIVSDSEICPVPVSGINEIKNNLTYPDESLAKGIEGAVTLSAKIDTLGQAQNIEILKSLNKECDSAAADAVIKTRFLPGRQNNKPINSKIVLNIDFKIDNKTVQLKDKDGKVKEAAAPVAEIPIKKEDILPQKKIEQPPAQVKTEPVKEIAQQMPVKEEEGVSLPMPIGGIERVIARMKMPPKAVELKLEGDVVFRVEVNEYGIVRKAKLLKGLGNGVDEAVENAIKDCPFKAAIKNKESVEGAVTLTIPFSYKSKD